MIGDRSAYSSRFTFPCGFPTERRDARCNSGVAAARRKLSRLMMPRSRRCFRRQSTTGKALCVTSPESHFSISSSMSYGCVLLLSATTSFLMTSMTPTSHITSAGSELTKGMLKTGSSPW